MCVLGREDVECRPGPAVPLAKAPERVCCTEDGREGRSRDALWEQQVWGVMLG